MTAINFCCTWVCKFTELETLYIFLGKLNVSSLVSSPKISKPWKAETLFMERLCKLGKGSLFLSDSANWVKNTSSNILCCKPSIPIDVSQQLYLTICQFRRKSHVPCASWYSVCCLNRSYYVGLCWRATYRFTWNLYIHNWQRVKRDCKTGINL